MKYRLPALAAMLLPTVSLTAGTMSTGAGTAAAQDPVVL